jgi:hypothetical protein
MLYGMSEIGENRSARREICFTLPSIHSKLSALGSSACLRGEKPATLTTPF